MTLIDLLIVLLIFAWLTGSFIFPVGGAIHLLIVVLIVLVIVRVLQGRL